MPEAKHALMDGKLHVYRRENSSAWQCSTFLAGRNHRTSTRTDSLAKAKDIATDWYLGLLGKARQGEIRNEKTFKETAAVFEREYETITEGQRSARYVETIKQRLRVHLVPYFGSQPLSAITSGRVQEYRVHRSTTGTHPKTGKPLRPSRSTLHQELVALRQVLKTGVRHGWLDHLPDLSPPYKTSGKLSHRAWFSPEEYRQLYSATRRRSQKNRGTQWQRGSEDLHDYVLFMANTGLRPDEASRLEFRDVAIVEEAGTHILEITARGKRGTGYCKSTPNAVRPFERIVARNTAAGKPKPEPAALLFPASHRNLFNDILVEEGLKKDREGTARTAYSLRHTYICMRLMEGADINKAGVRRADPSNLLQQRHPFVALARADLFEHLLEFGVPNSIAASVVAKVDFAIDDGIVAFDRDDGSVMMWTHVEDPDGQTRHRIRKLLVLDSRNACSPANYGVHDAVLSGCDSQRAKRPTSSGVG